MGILDEAIREHLELKREHGAPEPELQQLEDDAFGSGDGPGGIEEPPEMSDAEAEAPTDYIGSPAAAPEGDAEAEGQATPEAEVEEIPEAPPEAPAPASKSEAPPPAPEMQPEVEEPAASEPDTPPPAEEEHPAMEHEVVSEVPATAEEPPETEPAADLSSDVRAEREEIAQHPTEHYDVEEELAEEEKEAAGFFNEQSLSDELDKALDSPETDDFPATDPGQEPAAPAEEEPIAAEQVEVVEEVEIVEEVEVVEHGAEPEGGDELEEESVTEEGEATRPAPASDDEDEDVLEETPDFLQDTPEHDRLWFEQKPPKDFDFDD